MNNEEILKKVRQAKNLLEECLVDVDDKKVDTGKIKKSSKKISKSGSEDLHPPIEKLFQDGFFVNWQTDLEVCKTLSNKLLTKKTPLRASVVNVLRSMVKKGVLVREKIKKDDKDVFAYKKA